MKFGQNNIKAHYLGESKVARAYQGSTLVFGQAPIQGYLHLQSSRNFTLKMKKRTKTWDGILEWSNDHIQWYPWNGYAELYGPNLYFRGTGNTIITGSTDNYFVITYGTSNNITVKCYGNIETLLDYKKVQRGEHPQMDQFCFCNLFKDCTVLTQAPELPAITLSNYCYQAMFYGCTKLTTAPSLPATTLATSCYNQMFNGCTVLTTAPELPATTLADSCYQSMFYSTHLTQAPELPATILANNCYSDMFSWCQSLTQAPALPATTLAEGCYSQMFYGCTNLTTAPSLPATTLVARCYTSMFGSCSLTTAPELPATTLAAQCYQSMFYDCRDLQTCPELPATTLANSCYSDMFYGCTTLSHLPQLPATTLMNWCYTRMFKGCTSILLAARSDDEYVIPYRIPTDGTGVDAEGALEDMFSTTGGVFTGTPEINKIYYTIA